MNPGTKIEIMSLNGMPGLFIAASVSSLLRPSTRCSIRIPDLPERFSRLAHSIGDHMEEFKPYLNQAFNAVLFLFRHVLNKQIDDIRDAVRAREKPRLPVVLTRQEMEQIFGQLSGVCLLMAKVVYGCGLRLSECLKLRIKDIDFERCTVTVREGKGDNDRETCSRRP